MLHVILNVEGCQTWPGPRLNIKTVYPGIGIPMLKIRRSRDRLIFNMGIPIPVRRHLYTETVPRWLITLSSPWWRHPMETFSALLAIWAGNSPVTGEFPAQKPVTRSFDVFFDLRLNSRLSKQSWGWWFETLSRPLWRHCNNLYIDQTGSIPLGQGTCLKVAKKLIEGTFRARHMPTGYRVSM